MLKTIILILLCFLAVGCLLKFEIDIFKVLFVLTIIGIVVSLSLF